MRSKPVAIRSSGNIFADLGIGKAEEHYVKAQLVSLISAIIDKAALTQEEAAERMGVKQPDVSRILRGQFSGYSLERLLKFIRVLGSDIEIRVTPTKQPKQEGRISVLT